eukprot:m51a1_g2208 hypothetical protein (261) ;mRNA; f:183099-185101
MFLSLEAKVEERCAEVERRALGTVALSEALFAGFCRLDPQKERLEYISSVAKGPLLFKARAGTHVTELDAFFCHYPLALLDKVVEWHRADDCHTHRFKYNATYSMPITAKRALQYYAWQATMECLDLDKGTRLGITALERYHANFYIPQDLEPLFNENFLTNVLTLGEAVAADEKAYGGLHQAPASCKCEHKLMNEKGFKSVHRRDHFLLAMDDFYMTCLLLDSWIYYKTINRESDLDFGTFAHNLALQTAAYAARTHDC